MKYIVLSGSSESHGIVRTASEPNHKAYCASHGYQYIHANFEEGEQSWPKPGVIKRTLQDNPDSAAVLWLDCDAIFTNFERPLDYFYAQGSHPIMMTTDIHGPNCGVMFFRNNPTSIQFLYAVENAGRQLFGDTPIWADQRAIQYFSSIPPYLSQVRYVAQREMNSYLPELYPDAPIPDSAGWHPGDFILHLPGLPLEQRAGVIHDKNKSLAIC